LQIEALLRQLAHELEKDDASASRSAAELACQLAGSAQAQLAHTVAHTRPTMTMMRRWEACTPLPVNCVWISSRFPEQGET